MSCLCAAPSAASQAHGQPFAQVRNRPRLQGRQGFRSRERSSCTGRGSSAGAVVSRPAAPAPLPPPHTLPLTLFFADYRSRRSALRERRLRLQGQEEARISRGAASGFPLNPHAKSKSPKARAEKFICASRELPPALAAAAASRCQARLLRRRRYCGLRRLVPGCSWANVGLEVTRVAAHKQRMRRQKDRPARHARDAERQASALPVGHVTRQRQR